MIDVNIMSQGHEYFRIGDFEISPNNKIMAYSVDTVSRRLYTIYFMDLNSRKIIGEGISNTSGSITWANDNVTIFYNLKDSKTLRSERVMSTKYNTKDSEKEVYFEADDTFSVYSYKTKSDKYIVIGSSSTLSQEFRYVDANKPDDEFKIFQKRLDNLEYSISHFKDKWYIVTNKDNAINFK